MYVIMCICKRRCIQHGEPISSWFICLRLSSGGVSCLKLGWVAVLVHTPFCPHVNWLCCLGNQLALCGHPSAHAHTHGTVITARYCLTRRNITIFAIWSVRVHMVAAIHFGLSCSRITVSSLGCTLHYVQIVCVRVLRKIIIQRWHYLCMLFVLSRNLVFFCAIYCATIYRIINIWAFCVYVYITLPCNLLILITTDVLVWHWVVSWCSTTVSGCCTVLELAMHFGSKFCLKHNATPDACV